jgi:protein-S-isoprenylcysteine O-methyltransferase Ste14
VLFAAALAYFLFSYSLTFGEIATGPLAPGTIGFDVALFSVFALHHSIFARIPIRSFVRQILPAEFERPLHVWVASLMLIGVCYAWRAVPGVLWQISSPWHWPLVAVQLAGVWWTLRSAAVIDAFELAGLRTAQQSEFKTTGPYGWVRHPIYLGWIVIVFSVGTMTMTRFVFAVISSIYLVIAIPFEERTLLAQSPDYRDYTRRVPRKLIPGIY